MISGIRNRKNERATRLCTVLGMVVCLFYGAGCAQSPVKKSSADQPSAPSAASPAAQRPTLVFMTDFGTANDAVALCKAVMLGIAPDARIMDITHQVTPFSIEEAARFL